MTKIVSTLALFSLLLTIPKNSRNDDYDFQSMVDAINEFASSNGLPGLETSNIEFVREIETDRGDALFIDFDGNNGYAVLKNNEIMRFDVAGDFPEMREGDVVMREYRFFGKESEINAHDIDLSDFEVYYHYPASYSGDLLPIEYSAVDSYLLAKYGALNNFSITSSDKLDGLNSSGPSTGYGQYEDSVFYTWNQTEQQWYSEGNCGLTSTANALAYYSAQTSIGNLPSPSATTMLNPLNDSVYYKALENHYQATTDSKSIHTIYNAVRSAATNYDVENGNNYIIGGMDYPKTKDAYETAAAAFGASGTYTSLNSYYSLSFIQSHIGDNEPLQLNVQNDSCYDSHGMMMTGYRVYYSVTEIGGFIIPLQVVMASVYDGHSKTERWYDMVQLGNGGAYAQRATGVSIALYELEEIE